MSCCLFGLSLIGRAVPGTVIAYSVIMLFMMGPGICIHLLPSSVFEKLRSLRTVFRTKGKGNDRSPLSKKITLLEIHLECTVTHEILVFFFIEWYVWCMCML